MMTESEPQRRIIVVTGLSGGGKSSVLRTLEDLGYEAVDNPPLPMIEEMVSRSDRRLAVGVDARTSGFDASVVLDTLARLRATPGLRPELVYAWADETTLLRRYTETRRRHPLAPQGPVTDGIAAEEALLVRLHDAADLVIDTTDLPIAGLRRLIERHYGNEDAPGASQLMVSLVSFAYPRGLPREADLVFDARFLRNPHYDPILRGQTGLDPAVGAYVEVDPDCGAYFQRITDLVDLVLPRFVQEGKKYATITIGCTGGRHRSVYLIEKLAAYLAARLAADQAAGTGEASWRLHVSHRELARETSGAAYEMDRSVPRRDGIAHGSGSRPAPVQAQEA
ncbi:MAG: RNase adapter RapZ [Acetobacteraceae bacterium]|nr:RNase adapter RapZ [Acetobacteraceae bacterium]